MTACKRCAIPTMTDQRYCKTCKAEVAERDRQPTVPAFTPPWRRHLRAKETTDLVLR